jgi:MFS family permease
MCIMAGCVILTIGAALQCSAYSIPHMIVGRIVAGIGNGLNTSTIRMCRTMVLPPNIFYQLTRCSGLAFRIEQGC